MNCRLLLNPSSMRAFTLIELMVTIAVLAILVSLAAPAIRSIIQNNRVTSQTNEFVGFLHGARSEALRLRAPVSVCPGNVQAATAICGTDWTAGWFLYIDSQAVGATATGIGTLQRTSSRPAADMTHTWNGSRNFIRFLPDGTIDPVSLPTGSGGGPGSAPPEPRFDLTITGCRRDNARRVVLSRTGRVGVERRACP